MLFAGSNAGAERAAIAYSILGTCRLLGVNAVSYLADVLPQLAQGRFREEAYASLMPKAWKQSQAQAKARGSPDGGPST